MPTNPSGLKDGTPSVTGAKPPRVIPYVSTRSSECRVRADAIEPGVHDDRGVSIRDVTARNKRGPCSQTAPTVTPVFGLAVVLLTEAR